MALADHTKESTESTLRLTKELKKIGSTEIGKRGKKKIDRIFSDISSYSARHSWATLGYECGARREDVAQGLGHSKGKNVTETYIRHSNRHLDRVTREVIEWVIYGHGPDGEECESTDIHSPYFDGREGAEGADCGRMARCDCLIHKS